MKGSSLLCLVGALIVVLVVLQGGNVASQGTPSFRVAEVTNFTVLATSGQSTLYAIQLPAETSYLSGSPLLVNLVGSRYQMGYDYGYLLGQQTLYSFDKLFHSLVGDQWYSDATILLLEELLEWQWNDYLSKELPEEFVQEINGVKDGGKAAGVSDNLHRYITLGIILANMPGDLQDFLYILQREWNNRFGDNRFDLEAEKLKLEENKLFVKKQRAETIVAKQTEPTTGLQCSMFSVWGSRTEGGNLYSGRNLDWNQDTGINKNKVITVYNPNDGKHAHLTLGFAGLYGALTGMSSQGISVMEANLEENEITFTGFPWILRLRYVMENAANITEGKQIWEATQNTVGFNHMIASASDALASSPAHPAYALETMFNYTAYFQDNDPREASATYTSGNSTVQIGFPLPEALWRTNHGYDPTIREHYLWSQSPSSWSMERYMFAYEAFTAYEAGGVAITETQAVNITSILGDKGSDPYVCQSYPSGSNILSATYRAGTNDLWVAWEDGTGDSWTPAACNVYVHIDMNTFWSGN